MPFAKNKRLDPSMIMMRMVVVVMVVTRIICRLIICCKVVICSKLLKKVIALRDSGGMVPEDFLQVSASKVQHSTSMSSYYVTVSKVYLGFLQLSLPSHTV